MADNLNIALIMRLVNKVSGPAREVRGDLAQLEGQTDAMAQSSRRLGGAQAAIGRAGRLAMRGVALGAGAATAASGNSVRLAASMQDAWSEANKTLELTPKQLQQLQGDVDQLATRIPLLRRDFVDIAAQAGQIGIRGRESTLAFIEDAAKMSATFDVTASDAARMMGEWRSQMGYSQEEVRALADKINYLGNTTNASSAELAEYTSRIIGIARGAGMAEDTVLALGTSMIAMGHAPEVASTGLRALLRTMTKTGDAITASQQRVLNKIGLGDEWDSINRQMQTDAEGAIMRVVEGIASLPVEERMSAAAQLFGEEAQRSMGELLSNVDLMEQSLGRSKLLKGTSGSMETEFLALSDDVLDNWQKLKSAMAARHDDLGESLLGPINDGLKSTVEFITTLDERVTVFDRAQQAARGFFKGLDFQGGGTLADQLDAVWSRVSLFLVGDPSADGGEVLAGIFQRAEAAGERLGAVLDRIEPIVSSTISLLGSFTGMVVTSVKSYFEGWLGGAAPYLENITARLGPMADKVRAIFDNFSRAFSALGSDGAAQDGVSSFGRLMGQLAGILGGAALQGLDASLSIIEGVSRALSALIAGDYSGALAPVREFFAWLGTFVPELPDLETMLAPLRRALDWFKGLDAGQILPEIDWQRLVPELPDMDAALAPLRDAFDWLSSLDPAALLPDIDGAEIVARIKGWFSFEWREILPKWDWGQIIPELPDFGAIFGDADKSLEERLVSRASGNLIASDYERGLEIAREIAAGKLEIDTAMAELETRVAQSTRWGVTVGAEANQALKMLDLLKEIKAEAAAPMPEPPPIATPETLLEAARAAEKLEARFPALDAAARRVLGSVRNLISQIETALAGVDLAGEGTRLGRGLADGLLSQVEAVRAASAQLGAAIKSGMPAQARVAVTMSGGGSGSKVQGKRDAGGPVRRGMAYQVAERGMELFIPGSDGLVLPTRQITAALALASSIAPAAGITPARASTLAQVASPAPGGQRQGDTINITVNAGRGMDEQALAREIARQIAAQKRKSTGALYDEADV